METLLAKVGADTAFGLLVVAGLAHVRRLGGFRDLVRRQAIWPRQLIMPVVVTITTVELAIGLLGLVSSATLWSASAPALRRGTLLAASLLYLGFGVYGILLIRRRPGVPCACSHTDQPTNVWVPLRAFVLALCCGISMASTAPSLPWAFTTEFIVATLATASFVALAWSLPSALDDPSRRRAPEGWASAQVGDRIRRRDDQEVPWTFRPVH